MIDWRFFLSLVGKALDHSKWIVYTEVYKTTTTLPFIVKAHQQKLTSFFAGITLNVVCLI